MKLLILCSFILVCALAISSCMQRACCGPYCGSMVCILNTDTINRFYAPGTPSVLDSLNKYKNAGYSCNSNFTPYTYEGLVIGRANIKLHANLPGYGCKSTDGDGYCEY